MSNTYHINLKTMRVAICHNEVKVCLNAFHDENGHAWNDKNEAKRVLHDWKRDGKSAIAGRVESFKLQSLDFKSLTQTTSSPGNLPTSAENLSETADSVSEVVESVSTEGENSEQLSEAANTVKLSEVADNSKNVLSDKLRARQEALLQSGSAMLMAQFARDVPGADIERLQQAAMETNNPSDLVVFAELVDSANVEAITEKVIGSNNFTSVYSMIESLSGRINMRVVEEKLVEKFRLSHLSSFMQLPAVNANHLLALVDSNADCLAATTSSVSVLNRIATEIPGVDVIRVVRMIFEVESVWETTEAKQEIVEKIMEKFPKVFTDDVRATILAGVAL